MSQSSEPIGANGGQSAAAGHAAAVSSRLTCYFARHWRGELALRHAGWINGLAIGAIALSLVASLGPALEVVADAPSVAVTLTTAWALVALLAVWQVVGIWRSARRHAFDDARGLHPDSVRLALLVGVMISFGVFIRSGLPQIVDASQFAMGKDPIGDYSLRPLHEGTALEISGPIVFGLTDELEKALAAHPRVTMLQLDSTGGRVVEARRLRDLIRARGLATFTSTNCASACVVAFAAGAERVVGRGGTLGFHRYRSPGLDEAEIEASMAIDRRYLAAVGAPPSFLDKAFSTPNDQMWRPSIAELKRANIVTSVASPADVARSLVSDRARIESQLSAMPVYGALKRYEPQLYGQVVDAMVTGARRGVSIDEVAGRSRRLLGAVATKYLPAASDQAIVEATTIAAQAMRTLQSHSDDECYRYLHPAAGLADLSLLPPGLRERELASTAAIIETGASGEPQPIGDDAEGDLRLIQERLAADFGSEASVLSPSRTPEFNTPAACGAMVALYENAVRLPAPRNAQLLRYLLTGHSPERDSIETAAR